MKSMYVIGLCSLLLPVNFTYAESALDILKKADKAQSSAADQSYLMKITLMDA